MKKFFKAVVRAHICRSYQAVPGFFDGFPLDIKEKDL